MALVSKKKEGSTNSVLRINPYDIPEFVLDLVGKICTAKDNNIEIGNFRKKIRDYYYPVNPDDQEPQNSLFSFIEYHRENLKDLDFHYHLMGYINSIVRQLCMHENTKHTQVVVAGGFSSGKSSFLNRLTNSVDLLPTGVEPVSVIKTYLYCSKNIEQIRVRGVNQKNTVVDLSKDVLQAIQHASKSKVYLASVLNELFVDIPSQNLDGLAFIDTPGYNNSDAKNECNGTTDRETAEKSLKNANVLFWLVDCEKGTTVNEDLEMIRKVPDNCKVLIIFNKADKKGEKESENIVKNNASVIFENIKKERVIDIIAFSSLDNRIYYSYEGNTSLDDIMNQVRQVGNGFSELESSLKNIRQLFDDEIENAEELKKKIEDELKTEIDKCKESYNALTEIKDKLAKAKDDSRTVICDNFDEALTVAYKLYECSSNEINNCISLLDDLDKYMDSKLTDSGNLPYICEKSADKNSSCVNAHNAAVEQYNSLFESMTDDYRNSIADQIDNNLDFVEKIVTDDYSDDEEEKEKSKENIKYLKDLASSFSKYCDELLSVLNDAIESYKKNYKSIATVSDDSDSQSPDIFKSIDTGVYNTFIRCFTNGVDINVCNADGYNPMTYAVASGNNDMVRFMLDHDADPNIKDKRGYNAFHTAVENQFRDICTLLLSYDSDLKTTVTEAGEDVNALVQKHTFDKWVANL
jgi:GTP-binding protein EngB required for normal cell division